MPYTHPNDSTSDQLPLPYRVAIDGHVAGHNISNVAAPPAYDEAAVLRDQENSFLVSNGFLDYTVGEHYVANYWDLQLALTPNMVSLHRPYYARFCPHGDVTVSKAVSNRVFSAMTYDRKVMATKSVTGSGHIEFLFCPKFVDGTIVDYACRITTPVATTTVLADFMRAVPVSPLCLATADYLYTAIAFTNHVPCMFKVVPNRSITRTAVMESDVVGPFKSMLFAVGGFTAVAASGALWSYYLKRRVMTEMRAGAISTISDTLAVKPSAIIAAMAPSWHAEFVKAGVNPAHLVFFVNDVYAYLAGDSTGSMLELKAAEYFGGHAFYVVLVCRFLRDAIMRCSMFGKGVTKEALDAEMQAGVGSLFTACGVAIPSFVVLREILKDFNLSVSAAKSVSCVVYKLLEWLPNCLRRVLIYCFPDKAWAVATSDLKVDELLSSADNVLGASNINTVIHSLPARLKFQEIASSLRLVRQRLDGIGENSLLYRHVADLLRRVDNVESTIIAVDKAKKSRLTPFCICLFGPAGVGKTSVSRDLAHMFTADDTKIYSRIAGSTYWDGYCGQNIVVIDDLNSVIKPEYMLEFIQIVSNTAYFPQLASLDNAAIGIKGTPLTADVVICTTNTPHPRPADMPNSVEAINRRRHVMVEVRSTMQFSDAYRLCDPMSVGQHLTDWLTFEQLTDRISDALIKHRETESMLLDRARARAPTLAYILDPDVKMEADEQQTVAQDPMVRPVRRVLSADRSAEVLAAVLAPDNPDVKVVSIDGVPFLVKTLERLSPFRWELDAVATKLLAALGLATFIAGGYAAWCAMTGRPEPTEMEASGYSVAPSARKAIAVRKSVTAKMESGELNGVLSQYVGRLEVTTSGGVSRVNCLHTGRVLICPLHVLFTVPVDESTQFVAKFMKFSKSGGDPMVYEFGFTLADRVALMNEDGSPVDVIALNLPRHVPAAPDLRNHFVEPNRAVVLDCVLVTRNMDGSLVERHSVARRNADVAVYKNSCLSMTTDHSWSYSVETALGDCGGLLLGSVAGQTKIIGMHVARCPPRTAMATVLERTDIDELFTLVDGPTVGQMQGDVNRVPSELDGASFYYISDNDHHHHVSSRTAIVPSLIHGIYGIPTTGPSVLVRGDSRVDPDLRARSPLYVAISKYSRPGGAYDPVALRLATAWACTVFSRSSTISPEVLDIGTSINGDSARGYSSIDMATSPGYPWKKDGPKLAFFTDLGGSWSPCVRLQQACNERIEAAVLGKRVDSIWVDILKDERRPLEKIAAGKTRTIAMPPLDFLLVFRMYYLAFVEHVHVMRLETPSAIGMDCTSRDWDRLARALQVHERFFAGDISNNDGQFPPELLYAVLDVAETWYENSSVNDVRVRRVLADEIVNTVELAGNLLYMKAGGNPSGNPATSVFNTIGNAIQLAYTWFLHAPSSLRTIEGFDQNVSMFLFGDDVVGSVSSRVESFYNPCVIADDFASVGRKYTAADKHSAVGFEPFEDLTFLKRSFRTISEIPDAYVSQLSENVIYDAVNWVKKSDDITGSTFEVVHAMLLEWAQFGRARFEEERNRLSRALAPHMYNRSLVAWYSVYSLMFSKYFRDTPRMAVMEAGGGESVSQNVTSGGEEMQPIVDFYTRRTTAMPDVQWNLQNITERLCYFNATTWNTAQPSRTNIALIPFPSSALGSTLQSIPFNNYNYWRGDIRIKVEVSGTKFHTGKLIIGFNAGSTYAQNTNALLGSTHAILDASGSTSVILDFPYYWPSAAIPTYVDFWALQIDVFQPLQASTGTENSIGVVVSIAFPNSQFFIPVGPGLGRNIRQDAHMVDVKRKRGMIGEFKSLKPQQFPKSAIMEGNSISSYTTQYVNNTASGNIVSPIEKAGDAFDAKNAVDPVLSTAVGVGGSSPSANMVAPVAGTSEIKPKIVSQTKGIDSAVGRDLTGVMTDSKRRADRALAATGTANTGTSFKTRTTGGMDLEATNYDPIMTWQYNRPNFANACNIEPVYQWKTYAGSMAISELDDFQATVDESRLDYLVSKPGYWLSFPLNSTLVTGQRLMTFGICPTMFWGTTLPGTSAATQGFGSITTGASLPWCTYLSTMSYMWRGDLDLTFLFGVGAFTTGRLLFVYDPGFSGSMTDLATYTLNIEDAANLYTLAYDLSSQEKRITIRIPWMQPVDAALNMQGPNLTQTGLTQIFPYSMSNGALSMFLINEISTSNGAPSNILVECLIAGGPNLQFAGISGQGSFMMVDDMIGRGGPYSAPYLNTIIVPNNPTLVKNTDVGVGVPPNAEGYVEVGREQATTPAIITNPADTRRKRETETFNGIRYVRDEKGNLVRYAQMQGGEDDKVEVSSSSTASFAWRSEAINIVPAQIEYPISQISGERFASLRDFYKRGWLAWNMSIPHVQGLTHASYFSVLNAFYTAPHWPALSAFFAMRGGLRLTFEATTVTAVTGTATFLHVPWMTGIVGGDGAGSFMNKNPYFDTLFASAASGNNTGVGTMGQIAGGSIVPHVMLNDVNRSVTVEIPWQWQYRTEVFANLSTGGNLLAENPWGWIVYGSTNNLGMNVNVYVHFADDFRLGRNFRNPYVATVASTTSGNPWFT